MGHLDRRLLPATVTMPALSLPGCDTADVAHDRLVLGRPVRGDLAEGVIAKQRLRTSEANAFLLLVSIYGFRYHLEARLSARQLRPPRPGWALAPPYGKTSEAIQAVRVRKARLFSRASAADDAAVDGAFSVQVRPAT
jgi:hypothetical protein